MTTAQAYADASPPGVLPSQDGTSELAAKGVSPTRQMDATGMPSGAMDHADHQMGNDHTDHTSAPEASMPGDQTDAHLPEAATHADEAVVHEHETTGEGTESASGQHEPAEHGHEAVAPAVSSSTKSLVVGGFGIVNGLVIVAAAILKKRTISNVRSQSASAATPMSRSLS